MNSMNQKIALVTGANSGIGNECIHPGAVKTNLGSSKENPFLLKIVDKLIKLFFITPEQAAQPIIALATSPEFAEVTGTYFAKGRPASANPMTQDLILIKKIWELSEQLIQFG